MLKITKHPLIACLSVATSLLLAGASAHGQGVVRETVDIVGQSPAGPVVSVDGATLSRTKNGITIALSMPTPAPGSYDYPPPNAFQDTVLEGHPEVFTAWAFVFNSPEDCSAPCGSDDIGAGTPARGGVYNFAGHISGGGNLQLVGHVSTGAAPLGATHAPLDNPMGAEVHVAVAPHGTLQPDLLPTQITFPIGAPAFWWLAFFFP
jgi:hypothetical protein